MSSDTPVSLNLDYQVQDNKHFASDTNQQYGSNNLIQSPSAYAPNEKEFQFVQSTYSDPTTSNTNKETGKSNRKFYHHVD